MATLTCEKCGVSKDIGEFHKNKRMKNGVLNTCKCCQKVISKDYYGANKERFSSYGKERYENNRSAIREKANAYLHSERGRILNILANIRKRCDNPKNSHYHRYGGRGIKNLLSYDDVLSLWKRDKASTMKQPSIDRIDVNGNYELSNCQFIEMRENTRKELVRKVSQFDLLGNLIKIWDSFTDAAREGFSHGNISMCCQGYRKTHKGFIWKYV
jgi:hypothetical protein